MCKKIQIVFAEKVLLFLLSWHCSKIRSWHFELNENYDFLLKLKYCEKARKFKKISNYSVMSNQVRDVSIFCGLFRNLELLNFNGDLVF